MPITMRTEILLKLKKKQTNTGIFWLLHYDRVHQRDFGGDKPRLAFLLVKVIITFFKNSNQTYIIIELFKLENTCKIFPLNSPIN